MPFNFDQNFQNIQLDPRIIQGAGRSAFDIAGKAMSGLEDAIDTRAYAKDASRATSLEELMSLNARTEASQKLQQNKLAGFNALNAKAQQDRMFGLQEQANQLNLAKFAEQQKTDSISNQFNLGKLAEQEKLVQDNYDAGNILGAIGQGVNGKPFSLNELKTAQLTYPENKVVFDALQSQIDPMQKQQDALVLQKQKDTTGSKNRYSAIADPVRGGTKIFDKWKGKYVDGGVTEAGLSKKNPTINIDGVGDVYTGFDGIPLQNKAGDYLVAEPVSTSAVKNEQKQESLKEKQLLSANDALDSADIVFNELDELDTMMANQQKDGLFDAPMTGYMAEAAKILVPESARNTGEKIKNTLEAKMAFEELRKMRASSPTGGALGAISERELTLLSSAISSLDFGQDRNKVIKNIATIRKAYEKLSMKAFGYTHPEIINSIKESYPEATNDQIIRYIKSKRNK